MPIKVRHMSDIPRGVEAGHVSYDSSQSGVRYMQISQLPKHEHMSYR